MRKIVCAVFFALVFFEVAAAGKKKVDVDLTRLPATLIYGEVFNMIVEPEKYEGKTIRIRGQFSVFEDERNPIKKRTFACVIMDATACCAQGMEFTLKGSPSYPSAYPQKNSVITLVGTYHQHDVNGYTCTELVDCEIE